MKSQLIESKTLKRNERNDKHGGGEEGKKNNIVKYGQKKVRGKKNKLIDTYLNLQYCLDNLWAMFHPFGSVAVAYQNFQLNMLMQLFYVFHPKEKENENPLAEF